MYPFRHLAPMPMLVLAMLAGCSEPGPPRVSVSGKVTYKGAPVPTGTVTFVSDEQNVVESAVITAGEYTVIRAPVGPVKIGVQTPVVADGKQTKQKVEGKSPAATGKVVSVPSAFRMPATSGLTYTVTAEPSQTHDIPLK
jgi:hypothetical protein